MVNVFLELNSEDCNKVQKKKKKAVALCYRPRQKVKFSTFTSYLCSAVTERICVIHVQSCCIANRTYCLFAVFVAVAVVMNEDRRFLAN